MTKYSQNSNTTNKPHHISTALRNSSATHVPNVYCSSSECTVTVVHNVGKSRTQAGHQLAVAYVWKIGVIEFPGRQNLTFHNSLPIQKFRGTFCTNVHLQVTQWELAIFTNVGIQTDNVHMFNFSLLNCVICFTGLGSAPYKAFGILKN